MESNDRQEERQKRRQVSRQSDERRDIPLMKREEGKGTGTGEHECDRRDPRSCRQRDTDAEYSKSERPDPPPCIGSYSASIVKEDQADKSKQEKEEDQRHRSLRSEDSQSQSHEMQRQQPRCCIACV